MVLVEGIFFPLVKLLLVMACGSGSGTHVLESTCLYSRHLGSSNLPLALVESSLQMFLLNLSVSSKYRNAQPEARTHILEGKPGKKEASESRDEL